ncbi:MAG TPA: hypothetical protein VF403_18205, partial [Kofleriaceae bacterium]
MWFKRRTSRKARLPLLGGRVGARIAGSSRECADLAGVRREIPRLCSDREEEFLHAGGERAAIAFVGSGHS